MESSGNSNISRHANANQENDANELPTYSPATSPIGGTARSADWINALMRHQHRSNSLNPETLNNVLETPSTVPPAYKQSEETEAPATTVASSASVAPGRRRSSLSALREKLRQTSAILSVGFDGPGSSKSSKPPQFCPGAIIMRNKGLKGGMQDYSEPSLPSGRNFYWACRFCHFQSPSHSRPLRAAEIEGVIKQWEIGIQYKWMFLAKSHLRKKGLFEKPLYGCLICEAEGGDHGTYPDGIALFTHIYLDHSQKLTPALQSECRCAVGQHSFLSESWDIIIPTPVV